MIQWVRESHPRQNSTIREGAKKGVPRSTEDRVGVIEVDKARKEPRIECAEAQCYERSWRVWGDMNGLI